MTLADLKANAQGPHLFTDCVADGVLADVGLAAQEMPASVDGGALTGYLHNTTEAHHTAFILPEFRTQPTIFKGSDLSALKSALLVEGAMDIADLSTDYARGTSLSLQNVGFSPIQTEVGEEPFNYDYTDVLTAMLAEWPGRAPFVNCGDHNNSIFPTGALHFNNAFPLRCRTSDNPFRSLTMAANFAVDTSGWILASDQICADTFPGGASTRVWARTIYDPTHPTVFGLIIEHCTDLASTFGTQLRYMCHGESGISLVQNAPNATLQSTNVAPHMVTGFRAWLQHASGLGLTLDALNTRWQSGYVSFAAIDVSLDSFWTNSRAVADFRTFSGFLMDEIGWHEARACKAADTDVSATRFSFGTIGMERSGMRGDFAAVGDWQGEPEIGSQVNRPGTGYREAEEYLLRPITDAAVLSGAPGHLPITSPTFTVAASFAGQESLAPINRALRNYTTNQVNWLYRDALRSRGVGIGYLFGTPNFSFGAHAASKTAVLDAIEDIAALHPTMFAGCGGHSRVVLHVDIEDANNWRVPGAGTGAARTAHWIHRALRDRTIGCSIMHDPTMLSRPHTRAMLERSITVVPFHPDQDDLVVTYGTLNPVGSTGATVFLATAGQTLPDYAAPTATLNNSLSGSLYRCAPEIIGGDTNCWLLTVRPQRNCESDDRYQQKVALMFANEILPAVAADCADSWGTSLISGPITVTSASQELATNYVTDGVNFTVAVSNMATSGSASVTLAVNAEIATALDATYTPANLTVPPGETQFVALDATLTGIDTLDVQDAIDDAQAKVAALAGSYAQSAAQVSAILTQAESIVGTHPSRAAALYTSAIRAPLVSVSVTLGEATVTVQRLNEIGEATAPIEDATVLALWPLNLREHGPSGTTNGSGVATLTLGTPSAVHWDFATQAFAAPWADADEFVELHVTDPTTCASTRVTFTP